MVEEAPAAILPPAVRERLHRAAVSLLAPIQYRNAGTVEFLFDVDRQDFHFMEVNARIQVEHPVSEAIHGVDLVGLQLAVAGLEPVGLSQDGIRPRGHAIEVRIVAEDPERGFAPSPGRITEWRPPAGAGVRLDTAMAESVMVTPFYDSMIAKLIVHGADRREAIARLAAALDRFAIGGVKTNLELLRAIVAHEDFVENRFDTRWLERTLLPSFARS
jgi:acetyl-CoA carboxylase biotin carboxylase subunit